jgi:NAD(P)-dependent dehydrogenase (short-subunit alcohol dehydrogenase family)/acyl dehydratase
MKFTQQHIAAFCAASYDRNPLHIDAEYAQRTQFGRPVVYGVAAVLYALGKWADGRAFRMETLRAIFRKPLFEGEEYDLAIEEDADSTILRFRKGTVDYSVITFKAHFVTEPPMEAGQFYPAFEPVVEAHAEPQIAAQHIYYVMNTGAWGQLEAAFQLTARSMPPQQMATLLWASYHVGMALPGRQALFSELQVEFAPADFMTAKVELELDAASFDERFNRYVITGSGPAVTALRISTFARPLPADFPLSAMPQYPDGAQPLAGKAVFISGATRGFGAAMARMCALAGAHIALNYRGDSVAAYALVQELRAHGTQAETYAADMADPAAVAEMGTAISAQFGRLDLIVNNAAPPIRDLQFGEQDNAEILRYVAQNLSITLETARQLMPLLSKGGQFLHISTKYLVEPVRGFAHYLTAKAAQEALIQGLALEHRDHAFIVARLPRILTDQTNLPFDFDPPRHPGEVAMEAILALSGAGEGDNFRVVELFEREE